MVYFAQGGGGGGGQILSTKKGVGGKYKLRN